MLGRVDGKVAIVTGAGSGIGAASAAQLAREGAHVIVTDIRAGGAESVADEIRSAGGKASFLCHDVGSESDWLAATGMACHAGGLDIVVNNAATALPAGSVEDQTLDEWRAVTRVNLDGTFLGVKYGIAAIRQTGRGGSIINISSILGLVGSPTTAAYTASKGGVRLLTKSAALHCAKSGFRIRVNSFHPGWIRTPMSDAALDRLAQLQSSEGVPFQPSPLGPVGDADDIAYGVLYLASDESKFVTGSELVIDGGYTAQ